VERCYGAPVLVSVVYLAFGPKRVVETACFSALTLAGSTPKSDGAWQLIVYTDRPEAFRRYSLECEVPPLERVRQSDNSIDYPHRIKMLALRDCARHYGGDTLYLDGDTYFSQSAGPLFAALSDGASILHTPEYSLSEDVRPQLHRTIRTGAFESPVLRAARGQADLTMWNAGTVGVAAKNAHLLDEALAASDELYRTYSYHIVEQLSWSLTLAQATPLLPAHDVINHYWDGREQVMDEVVRFLHSNRRLALEPFAAAAFALRPAPTPGWRPPLRLRARILAREARAAGRRLSQSLPGRRAALAGARASGKSGPEQDHARERARAR
jgi:hypothetical protein